MTTSCVGRLYLLCVQERIDELIRAGVLDEETAGFFRRGGGLDVKIADRMSENVLATHGLPLSVALNFVINGRDTLIPMAVEEPSVVAAASNAAKMVRASGGFRGEASEPIMTAQIQFDDVLDTEGASLRILAVKDQILEMGDAAIPSLIRRGGGCRDLEVRILDTKEGILVCDLFIDVRDAMGANIVDTVAEAVAPFLRDLTGGRMGLRILSNLPLRRMTRITCRVSEDALGGEEVADGIVRASRFAELDPFRAVTHNKGFMNGLDAAAVALGQDWRSLEAAAHAYASISGRYAPLSTWHRIPGGLEGQASLPLAVGTVGGATTVHPGVRACFKVLQVESSKELSLVLASAGLASNLAALRALATDGIQKGHMRLHQRKFSSSEQP